jgi:hypothetical protein
MANQKNPSKKNSQGITSQLNELSTREFSNNESSASSSGSSMSRSSNSGSSTSGSSVATNEASLSSKNSANSGRHTPEFGYPDLPRIGSTLPNPTLQPVPLKPLTPLQAYTKQVESEWTRPVSPPFKPVTFNGKPPQPFPNSLSGKVYEPHTPEGEPPLPRELTEIMGEIHLANESDSYAEQYVNFTQKQKSEADSIISNIIDEFSSILRPIYSKANKGYNPNFDVKTLLDEYKEKIWNVRRNILYDAQLKETTPYLSMPLESTKVKATPISKGNTKWTYEDPNRNVDTTYTMKISKNPIFGKIRRDDDNVEDRLNDIEQAYDRISENYKAKFEKEKEQFEEWEQTEKEKIQTKYNLERNRLEQFPKSEIERDQELLRIDHAENEQFKIIEIKVRDKILVSKLKIIEMAKDRVAVLPTAQKEVVLPTDHLYVNSLIYEKIEVPFIRIGNNMNQYFKKYSERMIEGKCRKEGFIRPNSTNVISSSTGLLRADTVIYDVIYSVDVCFPYENMEVMCKIKNITKIGIRGIINEMNNPIVLFISREHNTNKHFEDYEEGQMIKVKVIGNRFELNDEYISVIGEII